MRSTWLAAVLLIAPLSPLFNPSASHIWVAAGAEAGAPEETDTAGYTYVHHPVSTHVPAAQSAFDRGLTLVFAYQSEEAERAFKEAARLDPHLAMAWWGTALARGPNINVEPDERSTLAAAEALERAKTLVERHGTASEKSYIEALASRYSRSRHPDFDALAKHYRDAMRDVVARYPDDPDARALFAEALMDLHPWRLWRADGNAGPDTQELVDDIETGLKQSPDHIGLLHFYIHAIEASNDPGRALAAARRLASMPMEPAAAHLVHMPAHIYMRVGDWESAVQSNLHAVHHALEFKRSEDVHAQQACGHCVDFLSYVYMMQGDLADARSSAADYEKLTADPTNSLAVLVRFDQWNDILAYPEAESKAYRSRNEHVVLGFRHFARGLAFVGTRRGEEAEGELHALQQEITRAPVVAEFSQAPDVAHVLDKTQQTIEADDLRIAAAILGARLAQFHNDSGRAIELMRQAVAVQDEIPYSEPPPWFYPVRESLGALLLDRGSAEEAEQVFRECLRQSPNDPRARLGLVASLDAQGRATEAAQERIAFELAWRHSDTEIRPTNL